MNQFRPFISPVTLLLVLILFVLPMITVQCYGDDVHTYTGTDLMKNSNIKLPERGVQPISASVELISVFALSVVGLFISLFSLYRAEIRIVVGLISSTGAILLVTFFIRVQNALIGSGGKRIASAILHVRFEPAFYVMLVSLIVSAVSSFVWYARRNRTDRSNNNRSQEQLKKCPDCSVSIPNSATTCPYCHSSLENNTHIADTKAHIHSTPVESVHIPATNPTTDSSARNGTNTNDFSGQKTATKEHTGSRKRITTFTLAGLLITVLAATGYWVIMPLLMKDIPDISGKGVLIKPIPTKKGNQVEERITFNAVLTTQDADAAAFLKAFELDKLMFDGEQKRSVRCVEGDEESANALEIIISGSSTQKTSLLQSSLEGERIEVRRNESGVWKATPGTGSGNDIQKSELEAIEAEIARSETIFSIKKRKLHDIWESESGYFRAGTMFQNLSGETTFEFADTSSSALNGKHLCAIIKYSVKLTGDLRPGVFQLDDQNSSVFLTGAGTIIYDLIDQTIIEDRLDGDLTLKTKLGNFIDDFSEVTYAGRFNTKYKNLSSENSGGKDSVADRSSSDGAAEQNGNDNQQIARQINPYFPYKRGKSYYFASFKGNDCSFVLQSKIDFIDSFSQKITFPNGNTADAVIMSFTEKILTDDSSPLYCLSPLLRVSVANDFSIKTNCFDFVETSQIPKCNCFIATPSEIWIGELVGGNPVNLQRVLNLGGNIDGKFETMKRELQDYDTFYRNLNSCFEELKSSINFAPPVIRDSKLIKYVEKTNVHSCYQQSNDELGEAYKGSLIWSTKGLYTIECFWPPDATANIQLVE
jgi:hypothetical protein